MKHAHESFAGASAVDPGLSTTGAKPGVAIHAARPPRPHSPLKNWLLGALLVVAVIFAYQSVWNAGFIWDDDDYVTHNPLLTASDGLQRIWFSTDSPSQYFPLTYTSFRVQHALWGFNASGYHWVNILLHAVNALLVWRLLSRLTIPGAWLGAALFALHPVHVESVAWITELKNVQSLFFFLLSLLTWIEFVGERRSFRACATYALSLVFCALALFSKTTACTLPAALLLILWWKRLPINRARLLQVIPFVALGLAMGLVTVWWERTHQGTDGAVFALSALDRLLIATRAAWFYLSKLLWPSNLSFSYPLWTINAAAPLSYAWLLAGLVLGAALWRLRRVTGRGPETAAVFFIAMLSPLLGFIMLYTFRYSYVADHYQYVASIAPLALAAAGITRAFDSFSKPNSVLRLLLSGILLAALGVLTWRQGRMYENLETLWRTTLSRNPASYIAHNNLSAILLEKHEISEARRHVERALSLNPQGPDLALALVNLGNVLLAENQLDGALAHFRKALEVQPNYADACNNLGSALLQHGRDSEAEPHFRKALSLQPDHANAHYNLGLVLLNRSELDAAIAAFETSLALRPDAADAHNDLGTALIMSNRLAEARPHLEKALSLRPGFAQAHNNLAFVLLRQGLPRDAIPHFRSALQLQPDNTRTLAQLAWVLATWPEETFRNGPEALALAQRASALSPDDPLVLRSLAAACAETGRTQEAAIIASRARNLAASTNPTLAAMLDDNVKHYQANQPVRDSGP
ncbi:MAG: tetratricopeptide repeat protein [Nibricoccus sp.]